ncbi:histidinol-phosphate aminotransferase [Humibacillus xanthopallidus]|uniref:Aromatic amino acid aminotransferase n=1 Tax=Humibacillus xanthopallidus TaxID=412689 RepID=A0A543PLN7_9MICO|nr:histidinol-phosphate transaminase [Humibacillus xanthopallidus]TQN44993.1 histidinol-phosphate aminotransferase [Humibacillus xanthopallidus]
MSDAAESVTESAPPREVTGAPEAAVRLREVLGRMPDYKPGKAAAAPPGVTAYKLSSNENPYGPLPSVLAAIGDGATTINRYPDMAVTALTERLAAALDVPVECLATGTGSVAVLAQIVAAACDAGDEVVFAWRSFEAYPIVTQLAGAKPVMVGLDAEARHRLDAMFAAITDRTRVILVCTPNNPTGPCVRQDELEAFLDKVPSDIIVVVDEAYVEFVRDPEAVRGLEVWRHRPNVVVLRTFSKAYGLAGLRVGYAVAHPPVAAALRKTATPFGVNSLAQVAAIASLDAFDELSERVDSLVAERDRVVLALADQGWKLPRSDANFVWFPLGSDSTAFSHACQEAGLMVRQYGDDGVRVTIGEAEANSRLIEVAAAFGAR